MGMMINQKTREVVLNSMQEKLKMGKIHINSERSFRELATFIINENGKLEADEGYNDDLVMSLSLGCYLMDDVIGGSPIAILTNEEEVEKEDKWNAILKSTYNEDYDEDTRWVLD